MSDYYLQPVFDQVLRLDNDQRQNPDKVIEDFLQEFSLGRIRYYLSLMLESCLTADDETFDALMRQELLFFCHQSEEAMEALATKMGKVTPSRLPEGVDQEKDREES